LERNSLIGNIDLSYLPLIVKVIQFYVHNSCMFYNMKEIV